MVFVDSNGELVLVVSDTPSPPLVLVEGTTGSTSGSAGTCFSLRTHPKTSLATLTREATQARDCK